MKNYEIERALVVSTAHVTQEEMKELQSWPGASYPEGCYVCRTGEKLSSLRDTLKSTPNFARLVNIAVRNRCSHVKLDRDGPIYKHLKVFNW